MTLPPRLIFSDFCRLPFLLSYYDPFSLIQSRYFRRRLQQRRSIDLISHPNFILFWSSLAVTHPNLHLWRNRWLIHLKISLLRRSFNKMLQFSPLHPSNLRRNGISNAWYSFETSFSHWYGVFFEREEGFASYPVKLFIFTEKGYDGGERWKDSPKSDNNLFSVSLIDRFPVFVGIQLLLHIS